MTDDDLDHHAILQILGLTDATAVAPVHGGTDTAIWKIEHAGQVYALRVFSEGQHNDCEREKIVWRNTRAGDPRADAARTVSILRVDIIGRPNVLESAVRRVFEQGWRAGYKQKGTPLGDLSLYYAWQEQ